MKPFYNTALTGNGRMLATFDAHGDLLRLFWPDIDLNQHIGKTWAALACPILGDHPVRTDEAGKWLYRQEYLQDSDILLTEMMPHDKKLRLSVTDFVAWDHDILIRSFTLENLSAEPVPAVLLYCSCLNIDESRLYHTVMHDTGLRAHLHYRRDKWFAIAGDRNPAGFQCGDIPEDCVPRLLNGNRLAMGTTGCQAWELGVIEPGCPVSLTVYITAGRTKEQVVKNITFARTHGTDNFLQEKKKFWESYLSQGHKLKNPEAETDRLFKKSLIVCKLLMNRDTGGIIAAPEFDETFSRCGGYGYCWGRDGVYIAHAMLKAGYPDYARSFYRWAAKAQNPAGDWPQRQYSNGLPAPVWGDQIDETGAVLWGICQYYKETWDADFLEEVWPTVQKAAEFLLEFIDKDTGLPGNSYDLWEERFGVHAYSAAAVYGGLKGAGQIAKILRYSELAVSWLEASMKLKERIVESFWDEDLNRFIRSLEDSNPDASLFGLTFPFGVLAPGDSRMKATVDNISESLTYPAVGGIGRYLRDCYVGGNPWMITTLWYGIYLAAAGEWEGARISLKWAREHKTLLGLLPEQADHKTGEALWAIPLAWSHAMFILLAGMLSEAGEL